MRVIALLVALPLWGCAGAVTSVPSGALMTGGSSPAGSAYNIPKGLVPVKVFADANGIGVTIEPPTRVADSEIGTLIAIVRPSAFNNEDIKLSVNPDTGFLTSVSSDSTPQLAAGLEELAKLGGRLALQSAKAAFLAEKVLVLDDTFDPLSPEDIQRINFGINAAVKRAAQAYARLAGGYGIPKSVSLTVQMPDGRPATELVQSPLQPMSCQVGICSRGLTARMIRLEVDGVAVGGKLVVIPARALIAVPVPQTVLAKQTLSMTINEGILEKYDLKRDSEFLGAVKIPGAIIGGFFAGAVQGLTDRKNVVDADKALTESETAKLEADKKRADVTKIVLQSGSADGKSPIRYQDVTLTIYPYSATLATAIRDRIDAAAAAAAKRNQPNAPNTEAPPDPLPKPGSAPPGGGTR